MLKVEHVTKKYGKVVANNDISFAVDGGQLAVLLGPNGAGKSTIIKCIAGLLRFQGAIELDGHPNKSPQAKRILGYVPEMPAVYELLTVAEHMEFIRRAYRVPEDKAFEERLLERLEMADKLGKLGNELSKGMQQKLSIICALIPRPRAVVFDEPLVGLDPHAIKQLKEIIAELRGEGASVLVSTHMLDSVEEWDVAHIMVNGSFAATKERRAAGASLEDLFFEITEGGRRE